MKLLFIFRHIGYSWYYELNNTKGKFYYSNTKVIWLPFTPMPPIEKYSKKQVPIKL